MNTISVESNTKLVVDKWFDCLRRGDGEAALQVLDEKVVWTNGVPIVEGLSSIVPWLGVFQSRQEVADSFVIWGERSEVLSFELLDVFVQGDEVLAIVHEVARIKATGLNYDIEFIQRIRVEGDHIASWKSYWDTAQGIVAFRGDLKVRLVEGVRSGNLELVDNLLYNGGDVNTVDPVSAQPLLNLAAGLGNGDMVKLLLKYEANPSNPDRIAGTSALHKACQLGAIEIVKNLVDANAFIDQACPTTGHTPLVEAVWYARADIVELLVSAGARLHIPTYYGFTLQEHIDYAKNVNKGEDELAQLDRIQGIIDEALKLESDFMERSPLLGAVIQRDFKAVEEAIQSSPDLEFRHPLSGTLFDGCTPLLIACLQGDDNIIQALIKEGADVNAVEHTFGAVPLHKATYNGHHITRQKSFDLHK